MVRTNKLSGIEAAKESLPPKVHPSFPDLIELENLVSATPCAKSDRWAFDSRVLQKICEHQQWQILPQFFETHPDCYSREFIHGFNSQAKDGFTHTDLVSLIDKASEWMIGRKVLYKPNASRRSMSIRNSASSAIGVFAASMFAHDKLAGNTQGLCTEKYLELKRAGLFDINASLDVRFASIGANVGPSDRHMDYLLQDSEANNETIFGMLYCSLNCRKTIDAVSQFLGVSRITALQRLQSDFNKNLRGRVQSSTNYISWMRKRYGLQATCQMAINTIEGSLASLRKRFYQHESEQLKALRWIDGAANIANSILNSGPNVDLTSPRIKQLGKLTRKMDKATTDANLSHFRSRCLGSLYQLEATVTERPPTR